jgi:hypothetical protein
LAFLDCQCDQGVDLNSSTSLRHQDLGDYGVVVHLHGDDGLVGLTMVPSVMVGDKEGILTSVPGVDPPEASTDLSAALYQVEKQIVKNS